jgi:CheY-like chemotaxis protein
VRDRCSILVVDDDDISLAVIAMLLESEGYEVLQASSGEEALETIAGLEVASRPAVVLADLQMPGLCGPELAADLRAAASEALLLAMSATPAVSEGYDGFLKKPLDPAALRKAIGKKDWVGESPDAQRNSGAARKPAVALDDAIFNNLLGLMPAKAVAELYGVCLNDTRERIEQIRAAAEADDLIGVRRIAHSVKGGVGMVGATRLAAAAAEIELGVYRKEDMPQLLNNLLDCCGELERILLNKLTL